MKSKLVLLLLATFSTVVFAEWTKVTFNGDTTMYMDTQSIRRNGHLVQVDTLMNMPMGTTSEDKKYTYKSSRTVEEFDCKKGISRTITFDWYSEPMGRGKKVYSDKTSYNFEKVPTKSLFDGVMKKVCQ